MALILDPPNVASCVQVSPFGKRFSCLFSLAFRILGGFRQRLRSDFCRFTTGSPYLFPLLASPNRLDHGAQTQLGLPCFIQVPSYMALLSASCFSPSLSPLRFCCYFLSFWPRSSQFRSSHHFVVERRPVNIARTCPQTPAKHWPETPL